jgi:RNA-binding protein YhbY
MLSDKWETLAEVAARTGADPVKVIDAVKVLFKAGEASMRIEKDRAEWIKENKGNV